MATLQHILWEIAGLDILVYSKQNTSSMRCLGKDGRGLAGVEGEGAGTVAGAGGRVEGTKARARGGAGEPCGLVEAQANRAA